MNEVLANIEEEGSVGGVLLADMCLADLIR